MGVNKQLVACPHCGASTLVEFSGSGNGSRQCKKCHKSFRISYRNDQIERVE
jgi:transposase-like protein